MLSPLVTRTSMTSSASSYGGGLRLINVDGNLIGQSQYSDTVPHGPALAVRAS